MVPAVSLPVLDLARYRTTRTVVLLDRPTGPGKISEICPTHFRAHQGSSEGNCNTHKDLQPHHAPNRCLRKFFIQHKIAVGSYTDFQAPNGSQRNGMHWDPTPRMHENCFLNASCNCFLLTSESHIRSEFCMRAC